MRKLNYIKGTIFIVLLVSTNETFAASVVAPEKIGGYIIPSMFANALHQGMTVPVYIRYSGDTVLDRSKQKVADAIIAIKDKEFLIERINLAEMPDNTELSPSLKKAILGIQNKKIGDGKRFFISKDASLNLDYKSFYFELSVSKSALTALLLPRSSVLENSSSEQISSVLNYSIGSYYNDYKDNESNSSYVTLDNTWGFREHHVNFNGSIYSLGSGDQRGDLYRAMYERDYSGHRFAGGMVDTWNLQSIAGMSALSSSRIYGFSYGNKSSSQIENTTLSLVPVTVFLPSAGEVHVYRDGKLLSIQNFSMGSYELDTSRLPFGIYNVDIQVIVNGRVVSSKKANINKTFARNSSVTGELTWQIFGGNLAYNKTDYRNHENINYGRKNTWIAGLAASTSQPWLSGVNLKSTLYGFDDNGVNETEVNVLVNNNLSLNQQLMLATDNSWKSITSFNLSIPGGFASLWGARQFSYIGNKLSIQGNDYFTIGTTMNLNQACKCLGTLTLSRTSNKYTGDTYSNIDYNQSLFSNRYASVSFRSGIQNYQYNDREEIRDKYINLDITIPFGNFLSTGFSSQNGSLVANATFQKRIDSSAINQVGASVSKRLKQSHKDTQSYQSDDYAANGYISYNTKFNAGTFSINHSAQGSSNYTLNSQGTLAWANNRFYAGTGTQSSGLVVKTNFDKDGKMMAQINGQNYPISGGSNYISLPPYAVYNVELMNDSKSEDSVDIVSGRRSKVVLYPGNVSVLSPEIKQLVTVFGRLKNSYGQSYANADIHNHIGKTRTDEQGEFAMDVDKRYPVITFIDQNGQPCETDLDLKKAKGAIWVGDITCEPQTVTASN